MLEFGSVVLYKLSAKVEGGVMQPRWERGVWLGKLWGSEEHMVATSDGLVVKSGAVKPHPEQLWDSELFDGIRGTPWDPSAKSPNSEPAEAEAFRGVEPFVRADRTDDIIPQARRVKFREIFLTGSVLPRVVRNVQLSVLATRVFRRVS